jgi:hypothetical protein
MKDRKKSERMKQYWSECEPCIVYRNGKKVHKRVCHDCGECLNSEGKPLFSELYN